MCLDLSEWPTSPNANSRQKLSSSTKTASRRKALLTSQCCHAPMWYSRGHQPSGSTKPLRNCTSCTYFHILLLLESRSHQHYRWSQTVLSAGSLPCIWLICSDQHKNPPRTKGHSLGLWKAQDKGLLFKERIWGKSRREKKRMERREYFRIVYGYFKIKSYKKQ